jgi:Rieske Fe-S protein
MRRRDFVRRLPVVTAGLAAGSTTILTGCSGAPYVVPTVGPASLSFTSTALGPDGDAFLQSPGMDRPVYVRRLTSGELVAVLAACTHRGCQPEPAADRLLCPCHGSEFTFTGDVLNGPADEPLLRYEVEESGGEIRIRLPGDAP